MSEERRLLLERALGRGTVTREQYDIFSQMTDEQYEAARGLLESVARLAHVALQITKGDTANRNAGRVEVQGGS